MDLFTNALGLTLLYVALLAIGIIYAVIILIGGGFGGVDLPEAPAPPPAQNGPEPAR